MTLAKPESRFTIIDSHYDHNGGLDLSLVAQRISKVHECGGENDQVSLDPATFWRTNTYPSVNKDYRV